MNGEDNKIIEIPRSVFTQSLHDASAVLKLFNSSNWAIIQNLRWKEFLPVFYTAIKKTLKLFVC